MKPQNFEERILWYSIIGTYGFYLLGALFIWVPLVAWCLAIYLCKKLWCQTEDTPVEERVTVPFVVLVWIVCMSVMSIDVVMGHLDFDLGVAQTVSSLLDFTKSWALFALLPLAGCLKVRPQLIYRAICITCLQSLIFIAVNYLMIFLHIPAISYLSPLHAIGHGGSGYYTVSIAGTSFDPLSPTAGNEIRMQLLAPWAPALGLVGNVYFFLARQEPNNKWRWLGMVGAVAMVWVSVSRAALLCLPSVILLTWISPIFTRPTMQIIGGGVSFLAGIFATVLIDLFKDFREQFNNARAGSSRIRKLLGEIELYRWQKEAPVWGHGIAESPGPKTVEHMPIGSHDTWFALLFIKGLVGFIALAVPFLWSFIDLIIKAQNSKTARVGLSILLVLLVFTFSEGLDLLIYIFWPGLVMVGIAFKEKASNSVPDGDKYGIFKSI